MSGEAFRLPALQYHLLGFQRTASGSQLAGAFSFSKDTFMLRASETSSQTLEWKGLKALNGGVEDSRMRGAEFRM